MIPRANTLALALVTIFGMSGAVASAQNVVGRTMVGGAVVVLYDDGTWGHEGDVERDIGCAFLYRGVNFCGETFGWQRVSYATAGADAIFRSPEIGQYSYFNVYREGFNTGATLDVLEYRLRANLSVHDGILFESTQFFKHLGYDGITMQYSWLQDEQRVRALGTMISLEDRYVWIETYSALGEDIAVFSGIHENFIDNVGFEVSP